MSQTLKNLLGWLVLVALMMLVLDWQDTAEQLRQESETSSRMRLRLESQTRAVDWLAAARTAQDAQDAWLDRLVEVETTGVFRAVAMERMADLCQSLDTPCQVGAEGEKVLSTVDKTVNATGSMGRTTELPGLVSATVRVTMPLGKPGMRDVIQEIETGHILRNIDRFSVRSGRVEIMVQNFGMSAQQQGRLRKSVPVSREATP